jgi:hypothetical protein
MQRIRISDVQGNCPCTHTQRDFHRLLQPYSVRTTYHWLSVSNGAESGAITWDTRRPRARGPDFMSERNECGPFPTTRSTVLSRVTAPSQFTRVQTRKSHDCFPTILVLNALKVTHLSNCHRFDLLLLIEQWKKIYRIWGSLGVNG